MSKKTQKPKNVYTVRVGSSHAKVYVTPKPSGTYYTLVYRDRNNVRQRKTFTHLQTAKQEGENLLREQLQGRQDADVLTDTDRLILSRAKKALGEIGNVPLDLAVLQYVEAVKVLDGVPLNEAVRYFSRMRPTGDYKKQVEEVVKKLLEDRERNGVSTSYFRSLRTHLNRFSNAFRCTLFSVTPEQVAEYLHGLGVGDISRKNHRNSIGTLFNFAKKRGYLPTDHLGPGEPVKVRSRNRGEATIFSSEELKAVLKVAPISVLPGVLVGAFAGLRTAEIERLDWSQVHLKKKLIEVKGANAKTRTRRLVPILPNLLEWLTILHQGSGRVANYANLGNKFWKVSDKDDLLWRRNGLRHSWISYRVSQLNSIEQVALEAGNSPNMVRSVYLEVTEQETASEWFNITPQSMGWEMPQSK